MLVCWLGHTEQNSSPLLQSEQNKETNVHQFLYIHPNSIIFSLLTYPNVESQPMFQRNMLFPSSGLKKPAWKQVASKAVLFYFGYSLTLKVEATRSSMDYMTLYPRRQNSSQPSLCESQILHIRVQFMIFWGQNVKFFSPLSAFLITMIQFQDLNCWTKILQHGYHATLQQENACVEIFCIHNWSSLGIYSTWTLLVNLSFLLKLSQRQTFLLPQAFS
jgi:hypothetical protein